MSTHESFPYFVDRRKPKQQASELEYLKQQRDSYVAFLLMRPRDEREQELEDRFEYIRYMHESNWNSAFRIIGEDMPIFTREKLLHPDEFVPLLCYPNAPFAADYDLPVVDYYVQPAIKTDKCSDNYDKFRDWLIEQDRGFFEDLIFIKSMPNLAVQFSFFAKTDTSYVASPEDGTEIGVYVDQEGYIVLPDTRLNFTVSNSDLLDYKDILRTSPEDSSPDYQRAFSNLVLYMLGEHKRVIEQQMAISQLHLQHYLCPDLEFVSSSDVFPTGSVPRT